MIVSLGREFKASHLYVVLRVILAAHMEHKSLLRAARGGKHRTHGAKSWLVLFLGVPPSLGIPFIVGTSFLIGAET